MWHQINDLQVTQVTVHCEAYEDTEVKTESIQRDWWAFRRVRRQWQIGGGGHPSCGRLVSCCWPVVPQLWLTSGQLWRLSLATAALLALPTTRCLVSVQYLHVKMASIHCETRECRLFANQGLHS